VAASVLPCKGVLLTVAVGAKQSKVVKPIIRADAVNVVQDQDQAFAQPQGRRIAYRTAVDQETCFEEPSLQIVCAAIVRVLHENLVERPLGCPGMMFPLKMSLAREVCGVEAQPGEVCVHPRVVLAPVGDRPRSFSTRAMEKLTRTASIMS